MTMNGVRRRKAGLARFNKKKLPSTVSHKSGKRTASSHNDPYVDHLASPMTN
jgi:hypothetical protein